MVAKLNPIKYNYLKKDFAFRSQSFLSLLPDSLQKELFSYAKVKLVKKGVELYRENEASDQLFFILSGYVKLTKKGNQKEVIMNILQPGDVVGDAMGFEWETVHNFSAIMMERGYILSIEKRRINKTFLSKQEWIRSYVKWGRLQFQKMQNKIQDTILLDKSTAIYITLMRLAKYYGNLTPEGYTIPLKLTNQEIAQMIGTSRETTNRELKKLSEAKIISIHNGFITIHQISELSSELDTLPN